MANHTRFEMKGFDEVKKRLEAIGPEMATKAGAAALRKQANSLKAEVIARSPISAEEERSKWSKLYGRLTANVKVRKGKPRKPYLVAYYVSIGSAFWGRFLEYGTVRMLARPFFGPAFRAIQSKANDQLSTELGKALDRIVKRLGGK